jgi:hypothetical protein
MHDQPRVAATSPESADKDASAKWPARERVETAAAVCDHFPITYNPPCRLLESFDVERGVAATAQIRPAVSKPIDITPICRRSPLMDFRR